MNLWLVIAPALLGLPAAALWLLLADPSGRARLGAREAAAWAAVIWASFASLVTELLSLGAGHNLNAPATGHFTRGWLACVWLLPALAAIFILWQRRARLAGLARSRFARVRALVGLDRYLVLAIAICALLVGFVAVASAPTTWDSMTYHLARVAAWLQLGGVAHYATHAEPQLIHPPGAEMLIAQLQALTGGDRYAALVQTAAYVLAIVVASSIARGLGGGRRAQLIAAFLMATAPTAILEGSSTQNDLVVGLWLMVAAASCISLGDERRLAGWRALIAAAAVGLAMLTKGTALIYLPPLLILIAWQLVLRVGPARTLALAAAGAAIVLALNAGQWERNHATYGQFIYSGSGFLDYSNDAHTPASLTSNLIRNSALYAATPSAAVNQRLVDAVRGALGRLGINPDDPATTFPGLNFTLGRAGPDESNGPSALLALLMLWSIVCALALSRFRSPLRAGWALMLVVQIVTFALLIKWQIWHTRLHLPVMMLAVPLIAAVLTEVPNRAEARRWITGAVVVLASITAPFYLALNIDRPLVSFSGHHSILTTDRDAQYFAARPELERPYLNAIAYLKQHDINRLAFYGGLDDWYYPFNALLGKGARTSYIFVPNRSAKYPQPSGASVEAVACVNCDATKEQTLKQLGLTRVPNLYTQPPGLEKPLPAPFELWVRMPTPRP